MLARTFLSLCIITALWAPVAVAQGFAPVVGRADGQAQAPLPATLIPITPTSIVEDALAAVKKTLAPVRPITPKNPFVRPVYVAPQINTSQTKIMGSAVVAPQGTPIIISQTYVQVAPDSFVVKPASALVGKPPPEMPEPPLQTESSIFGAMLNDATSTTLPISSSLPNSGSQLPSGEGLLFNNSL